MILRNILSFSYTPQSKIFMVLLVVKNQQQIMTYLDSPKRKKNDELNLPLSELLERYSIWKALTAYTNTF
jgi:hypothetical protein